MDSQHFRVIIKHLIISGLEPKQIYDDLKKTYGDSSPSYSTVKKWSANFKTGHMGTTDEPRSGRPKSAISGPISQKIAKIIIENRRISIRSVAALAGVSYGSCQKHIKEDLGFKKLIAKWVPENLSNAQKVARVQNAHKILNEWGDKWDELKQKLITSDETWVSYEALGTRISNAEWRSPGEKAPEIARISGNRKKVMMTVFWDAKGVLLVDFFEQDHRMGMRGPYYAELIEKLAKSLPQKRRGMRTKNPLLLIDNAPVHKNAVVSKVLEKSGLKLIEHPPYSPDLAPSDFFLFKIFKNWSREQVFSDLPEMQEKIKAYFESKNSSFYERGFDIFRERLELAIEKEGDYVEN